MGNHLDGVCTQYALPKPTRLAGELRLLLRRPDVLDHAVAEH